MSENRRSQGAGIFLTHTVDISIVPFPGYNDLFAENRANFMPFCI